MPTDLDGCIYEICTTWELGEARYSCQLMNNGKSFEPWNTHTSSFSFTSTHTFSFSSFFVNACQAPYTMNILSLLALLTIFTFSFGNFDNEKERKLQFDSTCQPQYNAVWVCKRANRLACNRDDDPELCFRQGNYPKTLKCVVTILRYTYFSAPCQSFL